MPELKNNKIAISGAGIAGLTSALALSAKGFAVTLYEKAPKIEGLGAGIQLSPNATRLFARLNILDQIRAVSTEPQAIVIKSANTLTALARVPLGSLPEQRWGSPYLVLRRSDLQSILLEEARSSPNIELITGVSVQSFSNLTASETVMLNVSSQDQITPPQYKLLIAADGVWSPIRQQAFGQTSRFTGDIAYRSLLQASSASPRLLTLLSADQVTTFAAPGFHLVSYPLTGGDFNLVIIARGSCLASSWTNVAETSRIKQIASQAHPLLRQLIEQSQPWTAWPIHSVNPLPSWSSSDNVILIGDAAHAMAPHAAQGAAMAIEDSMLLALLLARHPVQAEALRRFETLRRPRIQRVIRRGHFNHFAWQVGWPFSMARDLILNIRSEKSLAADFDWLYGFDVELAG